MDGPRIRPTFSIPLSPNADEAMRRLRERLAGTEDIRSCGAKDYVMRRFYELMRRVMRASLKAGLMINVLVNTTFVLIAIGNAVALGVFYPLLAFGVFLGDHGWYPPLTVALPNVVLLAIGGDALPLGSTLPSAAGLRKR